MKIHFKKLTAMLLLCAFACGFCVLTVGADDALHNGSITVNVEPGAVGTEMQLYEVADINNGKYVINEVFADSKADLTDLGNADASRKAAETLRDYAAEKSLGGTLEIIDNKGKAVFNDLSSEKLYLVVQSSGTDYVIQPLLACIPYLDDNNNPVYHVSVNAKFALSTQSAVILTKLGAQDKPLQGAEFSFQSKVYCSDESQIPEGMTSDVDTKGIYYWKTFASNFVSDGNGQIVITELPLGTYRFIEVNAPEGYILDSTPHEFTLDKYGTVITLNGVYVKDTGDIAELTVKNEPVPTESSEPSNPTSSGSAGGESSVVPSEPNSEPTSEPSRDDTPSDGKPVKTSDTSSIIIFVFVIAAAGLGIVLTVKHNSKSQDND